MIDTRLARSQKLFGEIEELQFNGQSEATLSKFAEMARLRESLAMDLLAAGDPFGWMDLFTAITAWGKSGSMSDAERLIQRGRQLATNLKDGKENIETELDELSSWLKSLPGRTAEPVYAESA